MACIWGQKSCTNLPITTMCSSVSSVSMSPVVCSWIRITNSFASHSGFHGDHVNPCMLHCSLPKQGMLLNPAEWFLDTWSSRHVWDSQTETWSTRSDRIRITSTSLVWMPFSIRPSLPEHCSLNGVNESLLTLSSGPTISCVMLLRRRSVSGKPSIVPGKRLYLPHRFAMRQWHRNTSIRK